MTNRLQNRKLSNFLDSFPEGSIILDMGAGRKKTVEDIVSIDIYMAPGVDILGDIHNLPFDEGSVDGIIATDNAPRLTFNERGTSSSGPSGDGACLKRLPKILAK